MTVSTGELERMVDARTQANTIVKLPESGRTVGVRTLLRQEELWLGEIPAAFHRVPNKPALSFAGQLLYPELIIVRLLERAGWAAGWLKNWGGRAVWRDLDVEVAIPPVHEHLLAHVSRCIGGRGGGVWDIVAWRSSDLLFIESKQRGKDALRKNQRVWLACGLEQGIAPSSFVIVEWQQARADPYSRVVDSDI